MNLAFIPARSGSKGLKNKNKLKLNGKPLIAWSIEIALGCSLIDKIIVSTDCNEISEIAAEYGATVDMRPKHLATDEAKTIDVVHEFITRNLEIDNIIILQPTSPLRTKSLLEDSIKTFLMSSNSNLATGYYCKNIEYGSHNNMRRQDFSGFFYDDGSIYILPRELVLAKKWSGDNPLKYFNEKIYTYEIDDYIDFKLLEILMLNHDEFK
jgi:CMP-N-acetylneuraminic acid synthetase